MINDKRTKTTKKNLEDYKLLLRLQNEESGRLKHRLYLNVNEEYQKAISSKPDYKRAVEIENDIKQVELKIKLYKEFIDILEKLNND